MPSFHSVVLSPAKSSSESTSPDTKLAPCPLLLLALTALSNLLWVADGKSLAEGLLYCILLTVEVIDYCSSFYFSFLTTAPAALATANRHSPYFFIL